MSQVSPNYGSNASDLLREEVVQASLGSTKGVSTEIEIRALAVEEAPVVDYFVRAAGGSLFQRSGWRRAVAKTFGHVAHDLVAMSEGVIVGTLPMMRCRGLVGGSHLISSPYGVYGGPVAPDAAVRRQLVSRALELAQQMRVGRLDMRCREPLEHPGLTQSDLYVTFVKDLPQDPEEVLSSMKKDERRLVRRAIDTHGLQLDEGPWFVEDLCRLFHASKQRLGSPGLPVEWFRALQTELGAETVTHIVRREGEVLAASMCFIDGDALCMYYIGTTEDANRAYTTTSFMIAELQKWAIARGLKVFDLGRSRRDAGAVKFKTNQGFEAQPLHYAYGLVRAKSLPSFTPSNPRTALLRKTWSRLPAWVCTRMSRRLSRHLP